MNGPFYYFDSHVLLGVCGGFRKKFENMCGHSLITIPFIIRSRFSLFPSSVSLNNNSCACHWPNISKPTYNNNGLIVSWNEKKWGVKKK